MSVGDRQRVRTVSVRALPGTRWDSLAATLGLSADDLVVEAGGQTQPLPVDAVVGRPPLVHGATVRPEILGEVPVRTTAPVTVRITSGPDSGGNYPLRPGGQLTIGRGSWCDVVIDDPGLSRHHLTLSTTRHGILVEDGASTNGTWVGAELITEPTLWSPGVPLRAGTSVLSLVPNVADLPRSEPDGEGRLVIAPRTAPPMALEPVELDLPTRNGPTAPVAPGALGWLIPLAVSVLLAVVLSMPALLLFGMMAPAMALGSHVGERRRYRRESRAADEAYGRALRAVHEAGQAAVTAELHRRDERSPDLARLLQSCHRTDGLLWSRTSEVPTCRLGVGSLPTGVRVGDVPEVAPLVPIEVDLSQGLSLVGPPAQTRALARSVLLQLAVLHPPSELGMTIADAPATDSMGTNHARWDWISWLPHACTETQSRHRVRLHDLTAPPDPRRTPSPTGAEPLPATTGDAGTRTTLAAEAAPGPEQEIAIALCHSESQAPVGTAVVAVSGARLRMATSAGHLITGTADLLSARRAHQAARLLAPLRDGSSSDGPGAVPTSVDLISIAGPVDADTLAARWARTPRSTRFLVGEDKTARVSLDLAGDGPHALVAGTTGAGKSELLRTLVTSLALVNRPDELVMVLVDYKGGSAFAEAAALPHVVGVITDLDPHLADRALTSLTAELKRRERILAEAGVPDLPAYQALGREPVPRLVIVIDEFRALAEELPDFLDGLVRIAALGRSLGVHLVLATQRPGGVVSADVRANVNLRIALRVRDGSDSYDVIDSPAAADLPEGIPGRALIRTGADAPRTVQVASSSTPAATSTDDPEPISVIPVHDLWSPDHHPAPQAPSDEGTSTLARAITGTAAAAARVGAVAPPSPWLPALPDVVTLADLPGDEAPGWGVLPLMLIDLPAQQRQPVHHWRPLLDGHLGVAGTARSGRSTVVRTVLAGLLCHDASEVHVYAFDLSGSLGPISSSPHVGAVLSAQDVTRGSRVLEHLHRLVSERQRDLAVGGYTSLQEQRDRSSRPWPLVVLVVDGWARFAEIYGESDRGRPLDQMLQVLREGLSVGIVALVTGDRSLLAGRIAPLLSEMWALRFTDSSDLLMAGLTRSQLPGRMPSGRAVRLRDGVVGQVGVVGGSADGADQVTALAALVPAVSPGSRTDGPKVFRALPREVSLDQLGGVGADALRLGLGGDAAEPVGLPVPQSGATVLGIVGPPRSGRSWALRTVEHAASVHGWVVVPVTDDLLHDPTALEDRLAAVDRGVLVTVDALDRVTGTAAEDVLLGWLDTPRAPGEGQPGMLVVTGTPEDLGGFRGLASRLARDRTGVILQPGSATDGSGLGVAVPTGDEPLPGRGVLVVRGSCTAVQVARPPAGSSDP